MKSLKSLTLLVLLFSISLAVFAEDAAHDKDEVKPSEATDVIEPQQRGCKYGCCGAYAYGQCAACCSKPQASVEAEAIDSNAVEPQQGRGGGGGGGYCRYGCCGPWRYGRCSYCCKSPQEEAEVVEPQQRRGCRYGCCGAYAYGQCAACCSKPQATVEVEAVDVNAVEPQQGRGGGGGGYCRHGCCGGWRYGRCSYCCKSPQDEVEVVEPQQGRGCRYGCCGSYAYGRCSACCAKKVIATDEEEKKEEAKP